MITTAAGLGLLAGCAAEQGPRPALVFEQVVVYCYSTLAAPECFARPIPDEQDRLLGVSVSGFFAVPGEGDPRKR